MGAVQDHIIWNGVFAISIDNDITVIIYSGPPNVNPEDVQKEQCLRSGSYQAATTPYGEQETKDVKNQIAGFWLQIAEMYMKRNISVSPDSCIFSYTEKH